jgi:hypothetical protein
MLRFPGDTANVFTWQKNGARDIRQGDFNGDGVMDYIDAWGNIQLGIQNGQPPQSEPSQKYTATRGEVRHIGDFNGDGFDDILRGGYISVISGKEPNTLLIAFGGADAAKLQVIEKSKPKPTQYYDEAVLGVYQLSDKSWRVVCYWDDYSTNPDAKSGKGGFVLYRMNVTNEGTQPLIELTELHRTTEQSTTDYQLYSPSLSKIYKSSHSDKAHLIALTPDYKKQFLFSLNEDEIKFQHSFFNNIGRIIPSIDGDNNGDYLNSFNGSIAVFSGGDKIDTVPFAKISTCSFNYVTSAGDINGDGIGDLAFMNDGNPSSNIKGCFSIVLGQTPTGITETERTADFYFEQSIPHPVSSRGTALLPVSIGNAGKYSLELFTLTGQRIANLFNDFLDSGTHNLPLNLVPYIMSSGTYTLRLSNGVQSVERTIIITE